MLGRKFILVDNNPEAMETMARRFEGAPDIEWVNFDPRPFQRPSLFDPLPERALSLDEEEAIP